MLNFFDSVSCETIIAENEAYEQVLAMVRLHEDCYLFSNNGHQYRENAVENFPRHMIWLILMLEYRDKKRVYIRLSFFGRFLNSQFFLFVFPARCM